MAPRTACSATGKVLCEKLGGEYIPSQDIVESDGKFKVQKKHSTLNELVDNQLISREELSDYLKFTCVRNPYDLVVSEYVKRKTTYQPLLDDPNSWIHKVPGYIDGMEFCKNHTFEEWVIYRYQVNSLDRLRGKGHKSIFNKFTNGVDELMKFENLQVDFKKILSKAGISDSINIPLYNKTPEKDKKYHEYYTKKAKNIVEYAFREELEKYQYSF